MKCLKWILAVSAVCVLPALAAAGAPDHYRVVQGPERFYYGHISLVQAPEGTPGPYVVREDGRREEAVLNLPIMPGDGIFTPAGARCEVLFDTGTVVRLDSGTAVRVETVLAASLSSSRDISNLVLDHGTIYLMYREYDRREMLQVMTGSAAVKLKQRSVASIEAAGDGSTTARVRYGKADVMSTAGGGRMVKTRVEKGQSLRVFPDGRTERGPFPVLSGFEEWNAAINADYDGSHREMTPLPKPVQNLPGAVFYFAQKYGNRYGEWVWDEYYGYVWRPFINDHNYPWGSWRPYFCGRWDNAGGRMFWVPEEPWGWVPYHLGIWQWDKKLGWVWLPGSLFAPAWVDWEFFMGYAAWRPWSVFDWLYGGSYGFAFYGDEWHYNWWDFGGGGAPLPSMPGMPVMKGPIYIIDKDHLKKPSASAGLPAPGELKSVISRVKTGLRKGDGRIAASAGRLPGQLVTVEKGRLGTAGIQNVAVPFDKLKAAPGLPSAAPGTVLRQKTGLDPADEARRSFGSKGAAAGIGVSRPIERPSAVREGKTAAGTSAGGRAVVPAGGRTSALRERNAAGFRPDWNPDARVASRLGARIEYSGGSNEVRCPELGISSADRGRFGAVLTSRGVANPGGGQGQARTGQAATGRTDQGSAERNNGERTSAPGGKGSSGGSGPRGGKPK